MKTRQAALKELHYQYDLQLLEVRTLIEKYTNYVNAVPFDDVPANLVESSRRSATRHLEFLETRRSIILRNLESVRSQYEKV